MPAVAYYRGKTHNPLLPLLLQFFFEVKRQIRKHATRWRQNITFQYRTPVLRVNGTGKLLLF